MLFVPSNDGNADVYHGVGPVPLFGGASTLPSSLLLLVLITLILVPSTIHASFVDEEVGGSYGVGGSQHPTYLSLKGPPRGTTGLALLPASPDCWLEAFQALKVRAHTPPYGDDAFLVDDTLAEDGSTVLNSMTCGWLTSEDQKVLALELSKCHMRDLGRPLFAFGTDAESDACLGGLRDYRTNNNVDGVDVDDDYHVPTGGGGNTTTATMASLCLKHLTDAGVTTYTHFFSYATQLCTRLLSEVVLGQYYETSQHLARSSRVAQSQIQALIEQQDVLFGRWNEREEHVLRMYDQLESHIKQQTVGLASEIGKLHTRLQEEHQAWTVQYEQFQVALVTELKRYQKEIDFLVTIVRRTQTLVQLPFSWNFGLASTWNKVQKGYALFQGIVYNVGGTFCVWLLTLPSPFRWMRRYTYALLFAELILEICILILEHEGTLDGVGSEPLWWRPEYLDQCNTLRSWMFHGNFNIFVFGILYSGICRRGSKNEQDRDPIVVSEIDDEDNESVDPPSSHDEPSLEQNPSEYQSVVQQVRQLYPSISQQLQHAYFVPFNAKQLQQFNATQQEGTMPSYPLPPFFSPFLSLHHQDCRTETSPLFATGLRNDSRNEDGTSRESVEQTAPTTTTQFPPYPHHFQPWMFPSQMVAPRTFHQRQSSPTTSEADDSQAETPQRETTKSRKSNSSRPLEKNKADTSCAVGVETPKVHDTDMLDDAAPPMTTNTDTNNVDIVTGMQLITAALDGGKENTIVCETAAEATLRGTNKRSLGPSQSIDDGDEQVPAKRARFDDDDDDEGDEEIVGSEPNDDNDNDDDDDDPDEDDDADDPDDGRSFISANEFEQDDVEMDPTS